MNANISPQDAELIQRFVDEPFEPGAPRQIIIAGPIGSGRTPVVSAIGTELAFKGRKLRYLSFDMLMKISGQHANASPGGQFPPIGSWGPKNIFYWPWFGAQTLIVDDVSPVIGTAVHAGGVAALTEILETGFWKIETELKSRNTLWVFSVDHGESSEGERDQTDETLGHYAEALQRLLGATQPPQIIKLPPTSQTMEWAFLAHQ
jgi:hypothetical protein